MAREQLTGAAAKIAIAREAVSKAGGRMFTASEMWSLREDFTISSIGLSRIFKGPFPGTGARLAVTGGEGTGKTSTCLKMIRDLRRAFPDRIVIIGDFEQAQEGRPDRVNVSGFDFNDDMVQIIPWSGSGEGFFETIYSMVLQGVPLSGVIFDSLNAMSPRVQKEGDLNTSSQMASTAAMFSNVLRKCTGVFGVCHINQFWILQQRVDPSKQGAIVKSAGKAVGHYADIRLDYNGGSTTKTNRILDANDRPVGAISQVTASKKRKGDKDFKPYSETELYLTYDGGIDDHLNLAADIEFDPMRPGQILKLDFMDNRDQFLSELETAGFTLDDKKIMLSTDIGAEIRIGKAIDRAMYLATIFDNCPSIRNFYKDMFFQYMAKPRQEVYPGEFAYPSEAELSALIKEIDSSKDMFAYEDDDEAPTRRYSRRS